MKGEARRYASWNLGYVGAPPKLGVYYSITLFFVVGATGFHFFPKFAQLAMLPFQFGGVFAWLYRPVVRRRTLPLRDLPAAAPQYAVRLSLAQGVRYGEDEGLASFVDGWLVFQGQGCAFSFRAADVKVASSETVLTFDGPCRPHRLAFDHTEQGFKEAWGVWRRESSPSGGLPVLPPIRPLSPREGWNHALTALFLGLGFGGTIVWGLAAWPYVLVVCLALAWLSRGARRRTAAKLKRIALGRPPRRNAWTMLGANVRLERLGEAFRADRRRRRRRRALIERTPSKDE